jgi:micrococcal nuclease
LKSLLAKTFLVFPLLLAPSLALAQNAPATVVSIGDGDTLRVRESEQVTTIRLGCIDSPERAQSPWGQQSTSRLKQLLPPGKAVQVRTVTRDRYGRTVAELYVGKKSVNLQMVKDGQAVVYRQYLSGCAATKDQYLQAEAQCDSLVAESR